MPNNISYHNRDAIGVTEVFYILGNSLVAKH
jgi:hypothetical protein